MWGIIETMIIFTGRFQPFHNGHVSLIKQLRKEYPTQSLCIAVIKDVPLATKNEFDKTVDDKLTPERNPFNAEITLSLINQVLKAEGIDNTVVTLMPRASAATWDIVKTLFDCERIWAFTKNQVALDDWEDKKAAFYQSMGDKVIRIPIEKDIEGTIIRQAIKNHDYEKLDTMVPKAVLKYIVEHGLN